MSLSPSIPQPGDVIAGKYQLVSVLGAADTGLVFLAERAASSDTGDMVTLHWYASGPAGRHAGALTEARLTALAHLPQRCGFRVIESLDTREAHYLVTEWKAGESLEARLTRVGPQPIAEVSRLLLPCIRAAHTAYVAGIVHHAFKATTIYVCDATAERAEHAKLLDFELDPDRALQPSASIVDVAPQSRTTARGGAARLSEAQRAKRADPRTAVRAFGAIMYRALTGRRHTPYDSPVNVTAGARVAPAPLLPPIVRWFLERALSDACEEHFNTLEQLAEALESMSAALPEISVRVSPASAEEPNDNASGANHSQPLALLPSSSSSSSTFAASMAPHLSVADPVNRPWATTMRLPRTLYAAPKPAPSRLPFAWIIAAAALVVTAGGLALKRDPRNHVAEEEVATYNAATVYDAPMPRAPQGIDMESKPWRTPTDDLPRPAAILPLAALAPALKPSAATSPLRIASLTPAVSQPPPPAARSTRPRTRSLAAPLGSRSASTPSAARAQPVNDRSVHSPSRRSNPIPKERSVHPAPAAYPRTAPTSVRPAAANGALDNMGLL